MGASYSTGGGVVGDLWGSRAAIPIGQEAIDDGLTAMKEADYQPEMKKWEAELKQKMLLP